MISIFFFVCIPITLLCALLGDIPYLIVITKNYITAGNSIFFPFLSFNNIFWFLPDKFQFISINSGFLIDSIIILNISALLERCAYQFYIKICLEEDFQESFDLCSKDQISLLYQGSVILFGLINEPIVSSNDMILSIKSKKNQDLLCKYKDFYYSIAEENLKFNNFNIRKQSYLIFIFINSYFLQFVTISDIEKLDKISINQYLYPQPNISHLTKPFQLEG